MAEGTGQRISIVYYLEGAVAEWLMKTGREISDRFGLPNRYDPAPPHITLKYPTAEVCDAEDILELETMLQKFCVTNHPAPMALTGRFHTFPDARVIFAEVEKTREASLLHMGLMQEYLNWASLNYHILEMPAVKDLFQKFDFDGSLHITLASGLKDKYEDVWSYVRHHGFNPTEVMLDKISLIKIVDGRHVPIRTYQLAPQ